MMNRHESMRGYFAYYLYEEMEKNPGIYLLTGDLGYKMFDSHFEDFPNRCINCGASEQAMLGMACGLAMEGKIPVVYSITPFLIYRGFETIRNYIDNEQLNVKLVGSGRDDDYAHDGFSHDATDVKDILDQLWSIKQVFPSNKESMSIHVPLMLKETMPIFLSLKR